MEEAWRCAAETLLRLAGGMTARQGKPPHLTPGPSLGATAGWRYGTRLDFEEDRKGYRAWGLGRTDEKKRP